MQLNDNINFISEQFEIMNSKLDHLEYDLHELEEK